MSGTMYFGGIEGGATHSNLIICDGSGKVVGTARGLGTNHWTLGIEGCAERILDMVRMGKESAGIPQDRPLDSLGLTLSGCEQDSSNAQLAACVREKDGNISRAIYVASDTAGSLYTGAPDGGMVVIAGTGSNALLRTPDGEQHGCGGWGFLLGDEGGAYWIAHKAVKLVFDEMDGLYPAPHPIHAVWEVIREHFDVETRADLLPHAYKHFDKPHFAGATIKLSKLAYQGDPLARYLFTEAGGTIAAHIVALAQRTTVRRLRIVCVGSVWKSWELLKLGVLKEFARRRLKTELELVRLRVSSAMGAAWLAAKHINYELPRDDSAFCSIFYNYLPDAHMNGVHDNGTNGVHENGTNGTQENGNGTNGYQIQNGYLKNGIENGNGHCKMNGNHNGVLSEEVCGNC